MLVQRVRVLTLGFALMLACCAAQAATTRTFSGTGNFSDPTKWDGGVSVPAAGDDLVIDGSCTVDASTGLQYNNLQINMTGSLTFAASGFLLDVNGVSAPTGGTLTLANGGKLRIRGNFTQSGLSFSAAVGTTVECGGTTPQSIAGLSYANLIIDNSAGVTLAGITGISGTLTIGNTVANSFLKDGGNQINAASASLVMQNGSALVIGAGLGATTLPAFAGGAALDPATTIEFGANATQTIANRTYRNLKLSGSAGTKNFPGGAGVTIQETLTVNTSCALNSFDVNVFNVAGSNGIGMGNGNLVVSGNWTNTASTGTAGGSGEVRFTGNNPAISGANFEHVRFQNTGTANVTGTLTLISSSTIEAGSVVQVQNIDGGGTFAPSSNTILRVSGAYSLSNTIYANNVRVDYNGSGAQTVALDDYTDLEISQNRGTNIVTFAAGIIGITGQFINNASFSVGGGFDLSGNTIDYKGTGVQTVIPFKYHDLKITCNRPANNVTFGPGVIGIAGSFSFMSAPFSGGQCITAGSTFEFYGTGQTIPEPTPEFVYDSVVVSGTAILDTNPSSMTFKKDLTITPTGDLDLGILELFVGGNVMVQGIFRGSAGTLTFNGIAPQTLGGSVMVDGLRINNAAGLTLTGDLDVFSGLDLVAGRINTGANRLIINDGTSVSNASDASHIAGNCRIGFNGAGGIEAASRSLSVTAPVGDGTRLVPVSASGVTTSGGGFLDVSVGSADHPSILSSGLDPNKSANRTYKIASSGVDNGFSLLLPFAAADLDAGVNTANLTARVFNGTSWFAPSVGTVAANSVQVTNLSGAFTGEFQIAELFTGGAPQITALSVSQNPVKVGIPVTFNVSLLSATGATFAWDFGDGSAVATTNPVTHTFAIEGSFNIKLTVVNPAGTTTGTLTLKTFAPASGGTGVKNAADGDPAVANPLNGLSIKVMSSEGGVIELAIDVDALNRAAFDVDTDFDGVGGRQSSATGTRPVTKADKASIIVATSSAKEAGTTKVRGKARKTLVVSRQETGEKPLVSAQPASTDINLTSMKGKFLFNKDTPDAVTFQGTIELPTGMDLSQPQEFSMGMGNVIDTIMLDPKGKAMGDSTLDRITKMQIKYPRLKKGETLTTAGQTAKVTITMSTANMDTIGFDTEGITSTLSTSEQGQKSVPRSIQVGMVLAGVAYEGTAPVQYKVSKKGDSGTMGGRGSAK